MNLRRALGALLGASVLGVSVFVLVGPSSGVANAAVPLVPNIKPDATLSPGQKITFTNTTPLIGNDMNYSPSVCRGAVNAGDPTSVMAPLTCRVYRIAINIDTSPEAQNIITLNCDFNQTQLPSLPLVAAGLNPPPVNGIDVYVWDREDHYLGQNYPGILDPVTGPGDPNDVPPGTSGFSVPERGSFSVKQKFYDIVVNSSLGVSQGYTLRVGYSNEIFQTPFEALDDPQTGQQQQSPDLPVESPPFIGGTGEGIVSPLPEIGVTPDSDIAGVGLGIDEQFTDQRNLAFQHAARGNTHADPPSTIALIVGMVALPLLVSAAGIATLRRRRQALIA